MSRIKQGACPGSGRSSSPFDGSLASDAVRVRKAKPFIKWAGGKSQLIAELLDHFPSNFKRYFEPMVGGGALFFSTQPEIARLSDINPELVNCYLVIKNRVEDLIKDLSQHVYERDYYYRLRDVDRESRFKRWGSVKRASRFICLNKSCFNGLYRVNSKGHFNVPFGRYANPKILDPENLRLCHSALQKATIELLPFETVVDRASSGDFVYFDPPYAPVSETACFTSYSKERFDRAMQEKLRDVCCALSDKDVRVMVSNSHTKLILDLYDDFNIHVVQAIRAINSKATRRGKIKEVVVTNY